MPSIKVMPSVESDPDWTTSPFSTLSPLFRMIETPLRIAVAVPDELGDMADDLAGARAAVGLRVLTCAGQRVDDVAGEMGAIGRRQRGALLALEVIVQDQFVVVLGKDQVDAGPLEVAAEKQMRVRDDDGVRRSVRGVLRKVSTCDMPMECRPEPSAGSLASNLPTKFNGPPQKVNTYIIFNSLSLHITWQAHRETISCLCKSCKFDPAEPSHDEYFCNIQIRKVLHAHQAIKYNISDITCISGELQVIQMYRY